MSKTKDKIKYIARVNALLTDITIQSNPDGGFVIEADNPTVAEIIQLQVDMSDFFWGYVPSIGGAHENYIADWVIEKYGGEILEYSPIEEYEFNPEVVY